MKRIIKAPTGTVLQAKSWLTEAPLRMLMNNLDPEVAERPQDLVVYGGIGKAARNWDCFDAIINALKHLDDDETLLVQSGKPVGVFRTHADAPRVLIANSNLVPAWANWQHFRELDRKGLMMYGQMTAGSWIYIGSQGIVQGTYETFAEMGRQHYDGDLAGRWILTAGLGGMGGAQPLAATMAGASMLAIECQSDRIDMRLKTGYLDVRAETLDDAMSVIEKAVSDRQAVSVGLLGNAAEILPEMLKRGIRPDAVTDQTSAHDPANGYLPIGWTVDEWIAQRESDPETVVAAAVKSMAVHVRAMLEFQAQGIPTFDYGNNIRQVALDEGVENAFDFPGFVPAYVRPLFCRGIGPFRWVALSGDPEDIYKTDAKVKELIPDDAHLHQWLDAARERIHFQGLPARICWVGLGQRHRLGLAFNEMVRSGELKAPVVIGRDHLDSGSVASPNRETEAMLDGSDAVSDWALLNALLSTASGATWVSFHHGGGVGMGYSQHAGLVIVCDGSEAADKRIARVLWNDPATGVMRHADAGYQEAIDCAREQGLNLPMLDTGESAMKLVIENQLITLADLRAVWHEDTQISLGQDARRRVAEANELIDDVVAHGDLVYGVNTGFGQMAQVRISDDELVHLQENLVRSHAVGVGADFDDDIVRLIMVCKVIGLAEGFSGVRLELVEALCALINNNIYPRIPSRGSVGASGDLAPLAHMAGALIGIGEVRVNGDLVPTPIALKKAGIEAIRLAPKEGLALLNGTQVSTALALAAVFRTENALSAALMAGAMTSDAIKGSDTPFDKRIQSVRGHGGQIAVAGVLRELMQGSDIRESHLECDRVQDPYSIRCQPQVVGACLDVLRHVCSVLETEANAVTDNPLVFVESKAVLSGGNFHAEPVALAADYLALAIAEIGALSERRIALLIDSHLSGLPPFLVKHGGLNSGFMMTQVTAAALASENKSHAHPASVDSIPTSANQEDHVSMATFAARRLHTMLDNVDDIIAIELLAAAQGIEFHHPQTSSPAIEAVIAALREISPAYEEDRSLSSDIRRVAATIDDGNYCQFAESVLPSMSQ